jgi:hypothetical protein
MAEETSNPFDVSSYTTTPNEPTPVDETKDPVDPTPTDPAPADPADGNPPAQDPAPADPAPVDTNTGTQADPAPAAKTDEADDANPADPTPIQFEWANDTAKNIYESLVSGNISEIADMMYEQKVLSELDTMDESDILKLKLAYEYPDLTPQEIEEEFASKYSIDKDFDESLMTDEEIAAKRRQIEKQEKAIARELKKDVRDAKEFLQGMRQDIDFPDILSQFQQQTQPNVNPEEIVNQFLTAKQAEEEEALKQARQVFEQSIETGLKDFEGFKVNYKDEDVQFDGAFNLTQEDKAQLQETMKAFDLESFYGNRYYKDGKYDTKQLAEDIYLLQNREKVVNAMVTQAVSKAKADFLKGIKNIDYSNTPRSAAAADASDFDKMVDVMFRS